MSFSAIHLTRAGQNVGCQLPKVLTLICTKNNTELAEPEGLRGRGDSLLYQHSIEFLLAL